MKLAKLDSYDSIVLPGVIRIQVQSLNDPDMVDIMSEIDRSHDRIYLDGCLYCYLGKYQIIEQYDGVYLELRVVELQVEAT